MKELVLVDGLRTPFVKSGTLAKNLPAQELARQLLVAFIKKINIPVSEIDQIVFGCVAQPADAANVTRVAAINAGLPLTIPAFTVHRNCASSMQAVTTACEMIQAGSAEVVIAGGTESLSNAPLIYNKYFTEFFSQLAKAKTLGQRLKVFLTFRPKMLNPRIGLAEGLSDPTCGLNMGQTAEILARDFGISRRQQDEFAVQSQLRAAAAAQSGRLAKEITPLYADPDFTPINTDNGVRPDSSVEKLAKLPPAFQKFHGTVTAGNSSQITDGAVALLITTKERAKAWGVKPLAQIVDSAYAGLDPKRMGLGPVFSTTKLLARLKRKLSDMQLVEINEAFAAQVLACLRAFASDSFAKERLGLSQALGEIAMDRLNVNGGAIALGHPVGSSGGRLLLTLALELRERNLQTGLATLCVGGGQGAAFVLERNADTQ